MNIELLQKVAMFHQNGCFIVENPKQKMDDDLVISLVQESPSFGDGSQVTKNTPVHIKKKKTLGSVAMHVAAIDALPRQWMNYLLKT